MNKMKIIYKKYIVEKQELKIIIRWKGYVERQLIEDRINEMISKGWVIINCIDNGRDNLYITLRKVD